MRTGYAHIAFPHAGGRQAEQVILHELTHNLLCHVPIPLWLNEGLAGVIQDVVSGWGSRLSGETVDKHRRHWNEKNIQAFWAGNSFHTPQGEDRGLSYSLGRILVRLLSDLGPPFIEFIKAANRRDAGQDAALNILNRDLGEVLGGFLGPGNWRPQRKAIADFANERAKK